MNNMFITKRESNILKGIGILSVILSHTSIMCREAAITVPVLNNGTMCMAICEAGMSLFLFISGYGLHMSYKARGLDGYIRGKLINVLIPYMLIQVIGMAAAFFTTGLHGGLFLNLSQLAGINSTNTYDPTMWYISYIIFWYIVFWIAYRIGKGSYVSLIIIGIVSVAGFLYVPWYWGNNADYCVMTFFFGVLTGFAGQEMIGKKDAKLSIPSHVRLAAGVIFAVPGYTLMIRFHRMNIYTENLGALMGMGAFILLVVAFRDKYDFRILYFIGTISFWLYLLEWKLIVRSPLYNVAGLNAVTYVICLVITFAAAYVCYRLYDLLKRR